MAEELHLDWETVKELDKQYMREQLRRAGCPAPRVIGIDEISIGKGHQYRIVVSDLERGRPIWFGGNRPLRGEPGRVLRLARTEEMRQNPPGGHGHVEGVSQVHAQGRSCSAGPILYDKFHILTHLGKAMDQVRKQEYARLSGTDRRFIKGQRYTLLSRWENLTIEGKRALKLLFQANRRLNKAYLLKESFGQLWDYKRPGWARRFFDNWRESLRWQRLEPFQKFANMVEAHWDGIEAYCHEENKVPLGFRRGTQQQDPRPPDAGPTATAMRSTSA